MTRFPGWRTMTAAQRYNARMDAMFERARMRGHHGLSPAKVPDDATQPAPTADEASELKGDAI